MALMSFRSVFIVLLSLSTLIPSLIPTSGYAATYGSGKYGRCQYQTCAVSLASSTSVGINVTPVSSGVRCSVSKDTVTVTTSSSTGYNLTLINTNAATSLTSGGNTIPATSGTYASPVALTANTWGYRIDSQGNFGAGPTSAIVSGTTPSLTFANIKPSTGTADTITSSSVAATNGASTSVWYGVCVSGSQPSGTYSDSVLYTALVN